MSRYLRRGYTARVLHSLPATVTRITRDYDCYPNLAARINVQCVFLQCPWGRLHVHQDGNDPPFKEGQRLKLWIVEETEDGDEAKEVTGPGPGQDEGRTARTAAGEP